jgi:hypothetical protein
LRDDERRERRLCVLAVECLVDRGITHTGRESASLQLAGLKRRELLLK